MRLPGLWWAAALLLALTISEASSDPESPKPAPSNERPVRYQRKVLSKRMPVTTTADPAAVSVKSTTPVPSSSTTQSHPSVVNTADVSTARVNTVDVKSVENARATRSAAVAAQDRWVRFVSDYVNGAANTGSSFSDWPKTPIKVDLAVVGHQGLDGSTSTVPVYVLPVPVPLPVKQECSANQDRLDNRRVSKPHQPSDEPRRRKPDFEEPQRNYEEPPRRDDRRRPYYDSSRRPTGFEEPTRPTTHDQPRRPSYNEPRYPSYEDPLRLSYEEYQRPAYDRLSYLPDYREPPRRPTRPDYDEPRRPSYDEPPSPSPDKTRRPGNDGPRRQPIYDKAPPLQPYDNDYLRPEPQFPRPFQPDPAYKEPSVIPPPNMHSGGPVDSSVLVDLFRAQKPQAPHLPAVLVRHRRHTEPPPPPLPIHPAPGKPSASPQKPHFAHPLAVTGEITVHRADYTEPYTAWWDPSTGSSRVDFHDGDTSTYRSMQAGRVRRVAVSTDRTGSKDVRRCAVMESQETQHDRTPPMFPNMENFSFDKFVQMGDTQVEQWKHSTPASGGARGEELTYHHEMLLMRSHDNTPRPLMYTVSVDSSVLGKDSDRYMHRFHQVHEHQADGSLFNFDIEKGCDIKEGTHDMTVVEPLREFIMMGRDPKYDELFKNFTHEYERHYVDKAEEAVRKNLLMQSSRFVSAGNRLGATFEMALNFLSDRLQDEVEILLGVVLDDEHFPAEDFPHDRSKLRDLADRLPDEFDWRQKGGVSPVKYQGSCSSCWAFAVAGAVEGALFRKTRRLVPLSEQCLVDCSKPYGGNGCKGTWPSHAYDYVQDRGLPAEKEYIPYQARVLECQDKRVPAVTQISAHVNVTQHSVAALKVAIRRHAPSVVIIDSALKSFQTYKKGVFYDDRCSKVKKKLKHAVLAVGWGVQRDEPHFILKNSWSAAWGDGGYVRVHGPSNTCGVLTLPSYPRLEKNDVLRNLDPISTGTAPAGRSADGDDDDDYD
ncbi:unnamed protein product [Diatraea saccharalis]|uniref:Uncharacterized protein n=1 Tax=Diatraea saccharalis TaxID=40085 RepID=A0A9N9R9M9_9NEOP|nr:unnamed protein product [Diatraea saccharalis]